MKSPRTFLRIFYKEIRIALQVDQMRLWWNFLKNKREIFEKTIFPINHGNINIIAKQTCRKA